MVSIHNMPKSLITIDKVPVENTFASGRIANQQTAGAGQGFAKCILGVSKNVYYSKVHTLPKQYTVTLVPLVFYRNPRNFMEFPCIIKNNIKIKYIAKSYKGKGILWNDYIQHIAGYIK